jgi:hypothetical protein
LHKDDGAKYEWTQKLDTYTITIKNPTVKDAGKYNLVVRIEKDTYCCGGLLEVTGENILLTPLALETNLNMSSLFPRCRSRILLRAEV